MSDPHPEASKKIDAYIAGLPDDSRKVCKQLRAIVHKAAPRLIENWKWSTPCFTGNSIVCGFAAFKKHVTFDFWQGALIDDTHGILNHGAGNSRGRGIKLLQGSSIPEKALTDCIRQAAKLDSEGTRAKSSRGKPPIVPEPLAIALALKKNARARAFFEGLPPSARREYCEWIASAKRSETVERRLDAALGQLLRGERMHEKYRK